MAESMQGLKRTHRCTELSAANVGQEVVVMGWVQRRRNLGQILFITLRDRTGLLQLSFGEHTDKEVFEKAETLRSEYVVAARGTVVSRGTDSNKSMKTGDIEIDVKELRILSEAETTPFEILENIPKGAGNELQLTDAMRVLARKEGMMGIEFSGKRYDMGNKLSFMQANVEMSLKNADFGDEFKKYIKDLAKTLD